MPAAVILVAAGASGLTAAVGSAIAGAIVGGAVSATVATAVGTAVLSGAITAAQGGSASDVLKSAVLGGVTAGVGSGISASIASDVAFQAIADGVSGSTAVAMGNVLGNAAAGAVTSSISAGIRGQDPVEALIRGGLSAGLSSAVTSTVDATMKDVPGFGETGNSAALALQRATKSAIATAVLGGSGTDAFEKSMLQSVSSVGGKYLGDAFRDLAGNLKTAYTNAQNSQANLQKNVASQQEIVDDYNDLSGQINSRYAQVTDARGAYDAVRAKYDAMGGDGGSMQSTYNWAKANSPDMKIVGGRGFGGTFDLGDGTRTTMTALRNSTITAVNNAANNYNSVVGGYNEFYNQNIGKITDYQNQLGALKSESVNLEKDYVTAVDTLKTTTTDYSTQELKNAALVQGLVTEINDASGVYEKTFGEKPTPQQIEALAKTGDIDGSVTKLANSVDSLSPEQKDKVVTAIDSGKVSLTDAVNNTPLDWLKAPYMGEMPTVNITGEREPGWKHSVDDRGYTLMWNEDKGLIQLYDEKDKLLHNWTDQFKYDADGNVKGRGLDYYLSTAQDSLIRASNQTASLIADVLPAMAAKVVGNESYFNRQMLEAKNTMDRMNRDYPSRVSSYKNVNDMSSAATYALEAVMEGVVSTAPSLLMGGPAGVAARASAKAAMDAALKRELAVQASKGIFGAEAITAAQAAASRAGLEVAAKFTTPAILASSAAQNVPEVFKNIYDAKEGKVDLSDVGIATVVGGFNAALDSILPSAIVDRLNLSKIPVEQVIGAWYKNAAKEAGSAFLKEGGTEVLQEMSSAAAEAFVAENKQFFSKENLDRFVDAGIKGGLGGSAVSTAFAMGADATSALTSDDIIKQGLDKTTPAEYLAASQMLKDSGFNATAADIAAVTSGESELGGENLQAAINAYVDPRVVKEAEALQAFKDIGYTDPTPEEIAKFIGQRDQAETIAALAAEYGPQATTPEEAKQMMRDLGYTNLTDQEAMMFAGKIKQSEAAEKIARYVGEKTITKEEVEQYFQGTGYAPTAEEIASRVRQGADVSKEAARTEVQSYADPRVVDAQEVRDAYAALGLKKPTTEDVQKLVGQYAETDLAGKAKTNLDPARYNSIMAELESMATGAGVSPEALDSIKKDFNDQFKALGVDVDALTGKVTGVADAVADVKTDVADVKADVANVQKNVLDKMADYESAGLTRDEALAKSVEDVATSLGKTKEDIMGQIGAPESTDADGNPVAATGVYKALETGLADVQKNVLDKMADYEAAGLTRDQALAKSVEDVATALGKGKEEILGVIGAPASVDADGNPMPATGVYKALETGLSDVRTDIGDVKTDVAGVKTDVGGVKTDVANLATDVQTKYDSLTQSQKDLAALMNQQGIDLNTAIDTVKASADTGFKNVTDLITTNQAATQKSIEDAAAATQAAAAAEAGRTRAANAQNAMNAAKLGNVNSLMQMLGQANDLGGQQVTVKAADPAKIGYIYDFNSIFANPSQEKMFASPYGSYAQGGTVEEVNEELLKILRG